jgi:hypothetical protein
MVKAAGAVRKREREKDKIHVNKTTSFYGNRIL